MTGTPVVARLSKAHDRVLCGKRDGRGRFLCGGELLELIGMKPEDLIEAKPGTDILYEHPYRFWAYRAGWTQGADGIWSLSPSAAKRWQREQVRASGNSARWTETEMHAARHRLATGLAESDRRGHTQPWSTRSAQHMRSPTLPAVARCPKCGTLNHLTERLKVATWVPWPNEDSGTEGP
jgi:hypothetical protein